ncbi:MAG: hypothetical protein LBR45_05430, partial [Bacteroidales bacterium]|nr:hypothetical protein [Bacteroidales bacterium]
MKNILTVVICIALNLGVLHAQNNDNTGLISLTAYVPEQIEAIPEISSANLQNKLNQIIVANGFGEEANQRFIVAANIQVLTKDITPTAPPMHAVTLEVNLYMGDGITGTLFSQTAVTIKGVGETQTKAYLNAFRNFSVKAPSYQTFLEAGKKKIIAYYNSHCEAIFRDAQVQSAAGNYEAAISILSTIPYASTDCYNKANTHILQAYKSMIDRDCRAKLAQAKGIWVAGLNGDAAVRAAAEIGNILTTISADASCFGEVNSFFDQVGKRVREIDAREWNYILQDQKLEGERIKAARDVGVAFGQGQQPTTYNVRWW